MQFGAIDEAEQLRPAEARFQTIFEQSPVSMQIFAPDGTTMVVNRAWEQLWGITLEQLGPYNILEDHQLVAKGVMPFILRGFAGEATDIPAIKYEPDVTIPELSPIPHRWVRSAIYPVKDEEGTLREVVLMHEDITQQVEAEKQYRDIFEATTDGMAIIDLHGTIVEVNPAFCLMYGYTRDEMLGLPVTALVHPDYHYAVPEGLQRVAERIPYEGRGINVRKDDTTFYMQGHATTFTYKGAPHILSIIRDITEQVQAEHAIQEERQRLSRELHDSVSQALYSIALGGKTARTLAEPGSPLIEPLDFVLAQAERGLAEMKALIFALRPEALEREGLVVGLQQQADALQARQQLAVTSALCAEPDVPLPLKEAIYRIAQEATHNIVKHAQATAVQLSLQVADGEIMLEVRDNGEGFDPDASFPGHLGLHSMRERATRLGGTLEIASTVGGGTTISVRLPIRST